MMADASVILPESILEYAESRVSRGERETASDYLIHLVQEDRERSAQEKLVEIPLKSLDSGPGVEATSEWWGEFRARLSHRAEA